MRTAFLTIVTYENWWAGLMHWTTLLSAVGVACFWMSLHAQIEIMCIPIIIIPFPVLTFYLPPMPFIRKNIIELCTLDYLYK